MTANRALASTLRSDSRSHVAAPAPAHRHDEHLPTPQSSAAEARADRLESWKEIAAFLNRTVRTAQRWERNEGLPVHRHRHLKGQSVHAYKEELTAWQSSRSTCEPTKSAARAPTHDWLSQLCYLCID